jgi:hypothetical protein
LEGDRPEKGMTLEVRSVFISTTVKSEFFQGPEIISAFEKRKITGSTESSSL